MKKIELHIMKDATFEKFIKYCFSYAQDNNMDKVLFGMVESNGTKYLRLDGTSYAFEMTEKDELAYDVLCKELGTAKSYDH